MNAPTHIPEDGEISLGMLTESLGFMLRIAQVRVFEAFFAELEGDGIKPGEFSMLWVLSLNPPLPQGSLARTLSIKPAHMTKLVGRLVKAGLVQRHPSKEDRRVVNLSLTRDGAAYVARHKPTFESFHDRERALLPKDDCETLIRILQDFTGLGPGAAKEERCR